ncbi:uncharacterized protein LOC122530030 [Frieseomelitta varia]|uniref:uncharacterized protein LOC122530030 n=1 Tax=Frieseomelitta varia TaxID=561572 RepID=UPI001CB6B2D1|nr:uncharacterized protein LOC122530030 [Frieseomelitta varia]
MKNPKEFKPCWRQRSPDPVSLEDLSIEGNRAVLVANSLTQGKEVAHRHAVCHLRATASSNDRSATLLLPAGHRDIEARVSTLQRRTSLRDAGLSTTTTTTTTTTMMFQRRRHP